MVQKCAQCRCCLWTKQASWNPRCSWWGEETFNFNTNINSVLSHMLAIVKHDFIQFSVTLIYCQIYTAEFQMLNDKLCSVWNPVRSWYLWLYTFRCNQWREEKCWMMVKFKRQNIGIWRKSAFKMGVKFCGKRRVKLLHGKWLLIPSEVLIKHEMCPCIIFDNKSSVLSSYDK